MNQTRGSLKEKFIQRTFSQFKSLKRAFVAWQLVGKNYCDLERFTELMIGWGFLQEPSQIKELYDWLDQNKDGKVDYYDLR